MAPLLLRIDEVQCCYDFCSWWTTKARDCLLWHRNSNTFLDLSISNSFDALYPELISADADLSHVVTVALLKIQLFFQIRVFCS